MILIDLLLYALAFVLIWIGSGFIVSSTSRFSEKLKLSSFAVSFLLLGLLTSTPEFSVGIQAVADHTPEIFVGNLIGGIIVIFLFIIPLLAILGNGISLKHEMDNKTLFATMFVVAAPAIFILDKKLTNIEGVIFVVLYFGLLILVQRRNGLFDSANAKLMDKKAYSYRDILKIASGVVLVFIASYLIVEKTIFFAELLNIKTFYISLLVIAIGTDLPEISLALRSVVSGNKEVAMGDYLGAAAASTLLFGIFTLLNKGEVITVDNFFVTFIFIILALSLFFIFSKSKKFISRTNGIIMMIIYFLFIGLELIT